MKTLVQQIAAGTFIALILLVGNVKAEGTETKASRQINIESTLQLENWMTDESVWNTNSLDMNDFIQETESVLELESWMTSRKTWNSKNHFFNVSEFAMELEDWMINEEAWNTNNNIIDQELEVEAWMINENYWR